MRDSISANKDQDMNSALRQLIAFSVLNAFLSMTAVAAEARLEIQLNKSWRFTRMNVAGAEATNFDDSPWQKVQLPHTWNNLDGQDGGNNYYRGTAWYRRHFKPGSVLAGKSFFLKFDGAATTADVFVNGSLVGEHKGNFASFCYDITKLLQVGRDNVIAVRVNNAASDEIAPLSGDFTVFGGLYRGVHLLALDPLSVSPMDYASPGVYIKQVAVSPEQAELEITTKLDNAYPTAKQAMIRCVISDRNGKSVQALQSDVALGAGASTDIVQRVTLANPHLWDGRRDPYLYQVAVEIRDGNRLSDRVEQPLGLRWFRVDPDHGFFLNGHPYALHGVNRHQDRLDKGWAIGPAEHDEDFRLIEELGCTAVRLAHYQHAQHFYDLCDRDGMVVWAELPLVNAIGATPTFAENARTQLTELIKQNFNHPSIVCWGLFNELHSKASWNDAPAQWDLVPDLNKLAKQLDPTRLTSAASCIKPDDPINTVTDIIAFNRYTGWYFGAPALWPTTIDQLREKLPGHAIGISEFGAGANIRQHEIDPNQPKPEGHWHPEEYQCTVHEAAWKAMKHRPWLWCAFLWNMFDFAMDSRDEGDQPGRNDKGLVTYDRKTKKDAFYWYKANWSEDALVYITSRRYVNRTEQRTPVKVYSNCDTVQLKVNGIAQTMQKSDDHIFLWKDILLKRGNNRIEVTGTRSAKRFSDSCVWKYQPSSK